MGKRNISDEAIPPLEDVSLPQEVPNDPPHVFRTEGSSSSPNKRATPAKSSLKEGIIVKTMSEDDLTSSDSIVSIAEVSEGAIMAKNHGGETCDPSEVHRRVHLIINRWGKIIPIPPIEFLTKLLVSRGYKTDHIIAKDSKHKRQPSELEMTSYDNELTWAVRTSNLDKIKMLAEKGKSMRACNKFCESILHMACRRSEFSVVQFLLNDDTNIQESWPVDDFGRTPLHDACWRPEPRFDVVTLLLDRDLDLLRMEDVRGSTPLSYVHEEHWLAWCAFFFHQKEKYWTALEGSPAYKQAATNT